jgi:hypothetical protein
MSRSKSLPVSLPPGVQRAADILQIWGNVGFWVQLVLGVVATVILLFASTSVVGGKGLSQGNGFGLVCAAGGVIALVVSIICFFRCRKIAQLMRSPEDGSRPTKSYTIQIIKFALVANLCGMFLAILGAESLVGLLLGKLLNLPQGAAVYDTSQLPQPKEVVIILANTHTITSHYAGVVIGLWLLTRLNR